MKKNTPQSLPAVKGAALVEYVTLLGLISIISIGAVISLGGEIDDTFGVIGEKIGSHTETASNRSIGAGDAGDTAIYAPPAVYADACTNNWGYIDLRGMMLYDPNPDLEWTFVFRRTTNETEITRLYFNMLGEQEYYGETTGVPDAFGRYLYDRTYIYPPHWDPCFDNAGAPIPTPA